MIQKIETAERDYVNNGWCEVELPDPQHISSIIDFLTEILVRVSGDVSATLLAYHNITSDRSHAEFHWELANALWEKDIGVEIGRHQYEFLRNFIGPDLLVQAKPFLRIARPGRCEDNIGFHRDTTYGQSPYEVTMIIPLVDLPKEAAIQVAPRTHIIGEKDIQLSSLPEPLWKKGSSKHALGFPYAPQKLDAKAEKDLQTVPLNIGQAMLFSPSLVHGQMCNQSSITRFSIDVRFLNANAPIDINRDINNRGYKSVHVSAIEQVAAAYLN